MGRKNLAVAIAFGLCCYLVILPRLAAELLHHFGSAGICFFPAILRTVVLLFLVELILIGAFCCVAKRSRAVWATVIFGLFLMLPFTGMRIRSGVHALGIRRYCEGFANRVQRNGNVAEISEYLNRAREELQTHGDLYKRDETDIFARIKSIHPGMVIAESGEATGKQGLLVSWSCAGGGVGIYLGTSPPPTRGWIDQAVHLTNDLWVVTRGE